MAVLMRRTDLLALDPALSDMTRARAARPYRFLCVIWAVFTSILMGVITAAGAAPALVTTRETTQP